MQLLLETKEIIIEINEGNELLIEINEYIKNYFSKYTMLKSATILHHNLEELEKKRDFLKWICYKYAKNLSVVSYTFLKIIQKNMHLPIRIKTVNHKYLVGKIISTIKINQSKEVEFETNLNNSLVKTYFKNYFKPHDIEFVNLVSSFKFSIEYSKIDIDKLYLLIKKESILGMAIQFNYDELELKELFYEFKKEFYFEEIDNLKYSQKLKVSYQLLDCHEQMQLAEIKKRYIELVKKYHPDNVYGESEEIIDKYKQKFRLIQNAYEILKRRHKYS